MWLGIMVLAIPILSVLLYVIWPNSLWLRTIAHASVLASGTFWLSAIEEIISGAKQFSLPLLIFPIVALIGTILSVQYGWLSTGTILGLYALLSFTGGIWRRYHL